MDDAYEQVDVAEVLNPKENFAMASYTTPATASNVTAVEEKFGMASNNCYVTDAEEKFAMASNHSYATAVEE